MSEKKNYSVLLTAYCSVLVIGAESEEKAMEYARDEVSHGDFEIDEYRIECEVPEDALENYKRHAEVVSEDDDR